MDISEWNLWTISVKFNCCPENALSNSGRSHGTERHVKALPLRSRSISSNKLDTPLKTHKLTIVPLTEEEKRERIQQINDRVSEIERQAAISLLIHVLAGFSVATAAAGVGELLVVHSGKTDMKNFMIELQKLEREKKELLNTPSTDTSSTVTLPEVTVTGGDDIINEISIPPVEITATDESGLDVVTVPEVVITAGDNVITIPEVVITD
jgi:hypothetical protein